MLYLLTGPPTQMEHRSAGPGQHGGQGQGQREGQGLMRGRSHPLYEYLAEPNARLHASASASTHSLTHRFFNPPVMMRARIHTVLHALLKYLRAFIESQSGFID